MNSKDHPTDARAAGDQAPDATNADAEQAPWREAFPVDWPRDELEARRSFAKFLVLTSCAFTAGQGWIAARALLKGREAAPTKMEVARLSALAVGGVVAFRYPTPRDPCLLVRVDEHEVVAFSQACTHLSCAVVPDVARGLLVCPCHEGFFDLRTGKNLAGPPPRPLPRVELAIEDDIVYAVGIDERTVV